jgi:hypothetical protein
MCNIYIYIYIYMHTCPSSHSCTTTSHYVVATGKEVAEVDDLANDGEEGSDEEGGEEDDSEVSRDAHPTLIRSRPFLAFSADPQHIHMHTCTHTCCTCM